MPGHFHECARFWTQGMDCPFLQSGAEDDDEPDSGKEFRPIAIGKRQALEGENRVANLTLVHSQEEVRQRIRQIEGIPGEGIAALVPGGLGSKLLERGPRGVMAVMTAIAIAELARRSGLISRVSDSRVARTLERQSAKLLSRLGTSRISTGQSQNLGPGRGGFFVNEAARMKHLFGLPQRRKQGDHSDPGFFFPGEPR